MYCSKCGNIIPDRSVFCNICGARQAQPASIHAEPKTTRCNSCGEIIPSGSSSCNYCGTAQPKIKPQPQYRQAPTRLKKTQETDEMPQSYYTDSWVLLIICLIVGFIWLFSGSKSGIAHPIYKGIIACAASFVFLPGIKVMKNPTGTLLVKSIFVIAIIIFL